MGSMHFKWKMYTTLLLMKNMLAHLAKGNFFFYQTGLDGNLLLSANQERRWVENYIKLPPRIFPILSSPIWTACPPPHTPFSCSWLMRFCTSTYTKGSGVLLNPSLNTQTPMHLLSSRLTSMIKQFSFRKIKKGPCSPVPIPPKRCRT